MAGQAPAGWPRDLPPPGTEEFDERVCGWLLDRGPADLRLSPVRSMPLALARFVAHYVDAALDGMRSAYASARTELGEWLPPDQIAVAQTALEAEGARLVQAQREVGLVEDALRRGVGARSTAER
ncbi:MAG: hypothetical protein GC156_16070 [Actinomycetales bacterium]|nr:hypothetical protein [Actinomycetales bacterium]